VPSSCSTFEPTDWAASSPLPTMDTMDLQMAVHALPTFIARVLSPSFVLLVALSLLFTRPQTPRSPSPITPVVVASTVPRRAVILVLLSLVGLSYLLDGLAFVVFAVVDHEWPRHSGIPTNTVTGVIAFLGLAALGAWKDIQGVEIWGLKRLKVAVTAALALDITLTVLLALGLRKGGNSECHFSSPHFVFSFLHTRRVLYSYFGACRIPGLPRSFVVAPACDTCISSGCLQLRAVIPRC